MLITLIKVQLKSMFSLSFKGDKKKTSKGKNVLYGILLIYVVVVFAGLFGGMFHAILKPFGALGLDWLYFGLMGIMSFLLCFIGSVFLTQTQIYDAKDNELLLSMPIPVKFILLSRLAALLIINYVYEILVVGPALVVFIMEKSLTPGVLLAYVIAVVLVPVFAITVSAAVGWIVAFVSSKMSNKNLVVTVLTVGLFMAYMYICFNLQKYLTYLMENGETIGAAVQKALPPFYAMGKAVAYGDFIQLLIFVAWVAVPFVAVYILLDRSFVKIATSKKGGKKAVYKHKSMKAESIMSALVKKEITHFVQMPMYMFNAGIGLAFMPCVAIFLAIKGDTALQAVSMLNQMGINADTVGVFVGIVLAGMAALVIISAPTISIEAKTLWISQSIPIRDRDVLLSKALPHIIVSLPFIIVSVAIYIFVFKLSIIGSVFALLMPIVVTCLNGFLGVLLNLRYPKFDWTNEIVAIKQGLAPFIATLVSIATVLVPTLLYLFFLKDHITVMSYATVVLVLFVAAALIAYRALMTVGVKLYEGFRD
ncbi:MAG: hypothetical protein RR967_03295 [Anaerovoracaceae bacterium]